MESSRVESMTSFKVMVVEDESRLKELLIKAIPDMGFEPLGASSGEAALTMMNQNPVDVVILDLNLPGMHGMEFMEQARKKNPHLECIILTGYGDLDTAKKAIHFDVVEFLTKPCTLGSLELALDRARRRVMDRRAGKKAKAAAEMAASIPFTPEPAPRAEVAPPEPRPGMTLQELERQHILASLRRNNNNRTLTAEELGISVRTLYYRIAEYERQGYL